MNLLLSVLELALGFALLIGLAQLAQWCWHKLSQRHATRRVSFRMRRRQVAAAAIAAGAVDR